MSANLNRRQFIKTTAAVTSVSSLSSVTLNAVAQTNKAKRVIFFYVPFGAPAGQWAPSISGGELQMSACTAPYESVKEHCVFFDDMNTFGQLGQNLSGLKIDRDYSSPTAIEILIKEFGEFSPMSFLPLTSSEIYETPDILGGPLIESPWQAQEIIGEINSHPLNSVISQNIQKANSLIEKTSGVVQSELMRYQDELNASLNELTVNEDGLEIPQYRGFETYSELTDYQIINMVSALKTNKTKIVHFMTGDSYEQPVIDGVGIYQQAIQGGNQEEYVRQRTAFDQKVADLITLLKDTNDSDGESLLESTLVVLYSNEGNGSAHDTARSPYMLAGGSFLNGGTINSTDNQLEFIDTIFALMESSYPFVSQDGPLLDIIG